jgi:hypothetical protein
MPTVSATAELAVSQGGQPRVNIYVDGHRAGSAGPFPDWYAAEAAMLTLTDDLNRVIRTTMRNWLETQSK